MSEELKPCPFCGNPPNVRAQNNPAWWFVECVKQRTDECPGCCWTGAQKRERAIELWNRRAPRFTQEEREALRIAVTILESAFRAHIEGGDEAAATIRKMIQGGDAK